MAVVAIGGLHLICHAEWDIATGALAACEQRENLRSFTDDARRYKGPFVTIRKSDLIDSVGLNPISNRTRCRLEIVRRSTEAGA